MQHFVARASTSLTRRFRSSCVHRKPWALRGAVGLIALLGTTLLPPTAARGVLNPPIISKSFGADTVPLGGSTTLTFGLQNPNLSFLTGVGFTDNLPGGLVVATPNGLTGTCIGAIPGTITATAGSSSITLTGGTLPQAFGCSIVVNVTGTSIGNQFNTTTAVTSNEAPPSGTASDLLTVVVPPTIAKTFGAASVPVGGTTTLTFDFVNPNSAPPISLHGVAFTDALPTGLVVATPNGLSNSCGGTVTATAGSGSINLTGGQISGAFPRNCSVQVNVTATTAGDKPNTTGHVTSNEGGTGGTASASLTVIGPPTVAKTFGAASVPVGGTTTLSFTITNPNPGTTLTGVAFTDALPAGLVVATPNGLTGSCGSTPAATAGSGSVSLTGGTIPAGGSCLFAVNVTATAAGVLLNTTGTVTSTNGGAGNAAVASLTVSGPTTPTPTPPPGACILGDINCDRIVDIRDYGMWRANFGQTNCGNVADLDGTCIVDIRDYGIWRANFGHTAGGAAPGGAPPAPLSTATAAPTRTPRPASGGPPPVGSPSGEGDREGAGDPPARPPELLASGLLVAGLVWRLRRRRDED